MDQLSRRNSLLLVGFHPLLAAGQYPLYRMGVYRLLLLQVVVRLPRTRDQRKSWHGLQRASLQTYLLGRCYHLKPQALKPQFHNRLRLLQQFNVSQLRDRGSRLYHPTESLLCTLINHHKAFLLDMGLFSRRSLYHLQHHPGRKMLCHPFPA